MTPKTISLAIPVLLVSVAACSNENKPDTQPAATQSAPVVATTAAPAPKPSAAPSAEMPKPERPRMMMAGPAWNLFSEARKLELKDEQKTKLDELEKPLHEALMADRNKDSMKEVHDILVEGVKAGKIDAAKLKAQYAEMDKADKTRKEAEATALNGLHEALDATQRKAVADAIKKKHEERAAKMKEREAKAPDVKAFTTRRMEKLTKDLGLDEAQQKKAEPIVAKQMPGKAAGMGARGEEMQKKMDALVAAFEKDKFDASKIDLGGTMAKTMLEAKVAYLTALLGVIKPEQRDKLAATLDQGPGGRRGMGMGGPMGGRMGGMMGGRHGGPPGAGRGGPDDDMGMDEGEGEAE
jgi:Spy/CpxP family protein refolding chaperone